MRKLLKMGLVVSLLVLALAFTGFAVQAADQAQNDKELNQDLNKDLNAGARVQSSAGDRTIDSSDDAVVVTRTVTADDGVNVRRGSLDRRGRETTKTDVSLGSDKDKWWNNAYHDNGGSDEGGDDEDEGGDEGGGETPTAP